MTKIRWGIISTALIGTQKVIPAMQKSEHSDVVAIASRSLDKAKQAAQRLNIPKAFGSYEALLADPSTRALYVFPTKALAQVRNSSNHTTNPSNHTTNPSNHNANNLNCANRMFP